MSRTKLGFFDIVKRFEKVRTFSQKQKQEYIVFTSKRELKIKETISYIKKVRIAFVGTRRIKKICRFYIY